MTFEDKKKSGFKNSNKYLELIGFEFKERFEVTCIGDMEGKTCELY